MASSPKKAAQPAIMMDPPQEFAASPSYDAPFVAPAAIEAPTPVETFYEAAKTELPEAPIAAVTSEVAKATEAPIAAAKDLRENVRSLFEKGIVQSRAKYAEAKSAAEEASAAVEASLGAARNGVIKFNVMTLEALKAGADANFDLFKSLTTAKSVSEFVTLSTEFTRKRFDDASTQSKELAALARKVAEETVAPIKTQVAKTFKVAV